MAGPPEVLRVLETLAHAFPRQPLSAETGEVYARALADIPAHLLWRAAERHIDTAAFFPTVAELRQHAARLANTDHFESLPPPRPDALRAAAVDLENAFFHQGEFDPQAWLDLAGRFEQADRPYGAQGVRRKLANMQAQLASQEQSGGEPSHE